jgi:hypothetical protein
VGDFTLPWAFLQFVVGVFTLLWAFLLFRGQFFYICCGRIYIPVSVSTLPNVGCVFLLIGSGGTLVVESFILHLFTHSHLVYIFLWLPIPILKWANWTGRQSSRFYCFRTVM